jgi:hypothetical protein
MTHLQTDDYTLAILPLAGLLGNGTAGERCPGIEAYGPAYHGVVDAGMFGYRLYTYHAMVRAGYGQDVERKVRERHTDMFAPVVELAPLLVMIRSAVGVGEVITPTPRGEVVTPVEMNVALALLLGYPDSPHYVTGPQRRAAKTHGMAPDIDWCLAACLARGRQEMIGMFDSLSRLVEMQGKAFLRQRGYWC